MSKPTPAITDDNSLATDERRSRKPRLRPRRVLPVDPTAELTVLSPWASADSSGGLPVKSSADESAAIDGEHCYQFAGTTAEGSLSPPQVAARRKATPAQIAVNLIDAPVALALHAAGVGRDLPIESWQLFLADFLLKAGNPSDSIEKALIEQVALLHQAICKLYIRAAQADDAATSQVCFEAVAKLVAEIPRLALAVRDYRGGVSPGLSIAPD